MFNNLIKLLLKVFNNIKINNKINKLIIKLIFKFNDKWNNNLNIMLIKTLFILLSKQILTFSRLSKLSFKRKTQAKRLN